MVNWYTQMLPPEPKFTESNLTSQAGKVFIVTGGNSGVGLQLCKILYAKEGTVYIAARSPSKIADAIELVKSTPTATPGQIRAFVVDFNDLASIKKGVSEFLTVEHRLDVLWNNAATSQMPAGTVTHQGYEVHMGVNCLGPFVLTKLLLPILLGTAKISPKASVRVVLTSSGVVDLLSPPGGITESELVPGQHGKDKNKNYAISKTGNWFIASELDKRFRADGLLCITQNPGNLRTPGWDRAPWLMQKIFSPVLHKPILGAYTELWAGLSNEVKMEDGGRYGVPWGRWHPAPREDILASLKTEEDGGTGLAERFWAWCEKETRQYV